MNIQEIARDLIVKKAVLEYVCDTVYEKEDIYESVTLFIVSKNNFNDYWSYMITTNIKDGIIYEALLDEKLNQCKITAYKKSDSITVNVE